VLGQVGLVIIGTRREPQVSRDRDRAPSPPQEATGMTLAGQPGNPLHALTTAELTAYRRQLERAIAFFGARDPVPAVRGRPQAALDAVITEQDERTRRASA
jgi:hypothetical protein